MPELGSLVDKVRSKNAGPFWLTIDIFCGTPQAFTRVCNGLGSDRIATTLGAEVNTLKRFEIPTLNVIKISLPRPYIQGAPNDPDMHGASWAALIAELEIN